MTATYLGIKGTRGMQEFLPNTYPVGATNPCPDLSLRIHLSDIEWQFHARIRPVAIAPPPAQRIYRERCNTLTRNRSTTQRWAVAARRNYVIAQNWLDLSAERGLSTFDQRHLLNLQMQYTTGMGMGGGTLLTDGGARFSKNGLFMTSVTAGTGLPLTPV